jgi:hypothetical protein
MAKGKYAKYIIEAKDPIPPNPAYEGKFVRHLMLAPRFFEECQFFIDTYIVYGGDAGWCYGEPARAGTGKEANLAHSHPVDEIYLFLGTDPKDPYDLGGEHEVWLGEGDEAEQYIFNKSTCVYIPRFVVHNPNYCRKVWRPYIHVALIPNIAGTFHKDNIPLPKGFSR